MSFWSGGAWAPIGTMFWFLFQLTILFSPLPLAILVISLLGDAALSLWQRCFRQVASSLLAIAAMPICFVVVDRVRLFDPWLWYAMASSASFEALATDHPPSNGPTYAVVEARDESFGMPGINEHFVFLVYDKTNAIGLEPSARPSGWQTRTISSNIGDTLPTLPKGQWLYGHFYRVDYYD